jgi:hypothetical protein
MLKGRIYDNNSSSVDMDTHVFAGNCYYFKAIAARQIRYSSSLRALCSVEEVGVVRKLCAFGDNSRTSVIR